MPRERAEITVQPEGVVEVVIGTVSSGQGHETSFAQLVSEWLGVPIDSVVLVQGDTARVSVGGGSHSGRALRLGSIVMLGASNEIIAKGMRIAGHVLEAAAADLEFSAGRFVVKGTDRSIGIFEVAAAAVQRNDLPDDLRSLDGVWRRNREPRGVSLWLPCLRSRDRSGNRRGPDRALHGGR